MHRVWVKTHGFAEWCAHTAMWYWLKSAWLCIFRGAAERRRCSQNRHEAVSLALSYELIRAIAVE